ncbi:MAG: hypothetical protein HY690_02820 [Chloroflexi bacterium]|nr:hypothetical protein [Chloroflexota bacterium]
MATNGKVSVAQQLQTVQRLLRTVEQAHALARDVSLELSGIRVSSSTPRVTPLGYSLGICLGDAESSASRLAGLRGELKDLAALLEELEAPR